MTISTNTIRLLNELGVEGEDLLRVLASIDADNPEKTRSANAERQARFRAKKKDHGVTSNVTDNVTNNVTRDVTDPVSRARVDDNLQNRDTEPRKKESAKRNAAAPFKAEFLDVDPEALDSFIAVRKQKGGALTAYAATLFRADAEACHLPVREAIDLCISRGWITVKPHYDFGQQARGSPPRKPNQLSDRFGEIDQAMRARHDNDSPPIEGTVRYLPAAVGGR